MTQVHKRDTVFSSAARTATANSDSFNAPYTKGAIFFLDITAVSGTPTLDLKIQIKDKVGGIWHDVPGAVFAQKTTTGTDFISIYPGNTVAANASVSNIIAGEYRAVATIGGGTPSLTFTLSSTLIL